MKNLAASLLLGSSYIIENRHQHFSLMLDTAAKVGHDYV